MTRNPLHDIATWLHRPGPSGIPSVCSAQDFRGFVERLPVDNGFPAERLVLAADRTVSALPLWPNVSR